MNRNKLKTYAPQARRDFIQAVTDRATHYGLTATKVEPITEQGEVVLIGGRPFPKAVGAKRKKLEARIKKLGFEQTMEAMAYTWFNRLVAIRFMELHGYLEHGFRVLSHPQGHTQPEILEHAQHVDLAGLDQKKVVELKLDGTKEEELYRLLLIAQCNAMHKALPFLFESIDDETELLLPDHLLHSDSLIRNLVNEIEEEDWKEVEIIGWLYQFYISEKKDEVMGKVVASEDIPAATQLFTPNWIVKYLVENSLGRQWLATYPNSPLKGQMEFYIEPAEQTPEVQEQLKAITPTNLNPEELTLLDPACGSGHILVEAYDVFKAIYQERGYRAKDIPALILQKNLFGLEIDDRAAQLAAFALMMKARVDDRRIFDANVKPHVIAIQESTGLNSREIWDALNAPLASGDNKGDKASLSEASIAHLIALFEHGKTYGSLIQVPGPLAKTLPGMACRVASVMSHGGMFESALAKTFMPFVEQGNVLARRYDSVVANPPYMGGKWMNREVKEFARHYYPNGTADLFAVFIERGFEFAKLHGFNAMVAMQSWMFLASYESLRASILETKTILTMAHLGPRAFSSISGEVVTVSAFSCMNHFVNQYHPTFFRLVEGDEFDKRENLQKRLHAYSTAPQSDFRHIPGSPLVYWISDSVRRVFSEGVSLGDIADVKVGLQTGNNEKFVRFWHEVSLARTCLNAAGRQEAKSSGTKWFPYNKGGEFRRWYGNIDNVVDWANDGHAIRNYKNAAGNPGSRPQNMDSYFCEAASWSKVTTGRFALRYVPVGVIFDVAGCSVVSNHNATTKMVLSLLNSSVVDATLGEIAPTMNFEVGQVSSMPLVPDWKLHLHKTAELTDDCIAIAKADWDSAESSWDFGDSPLRQARQSTVSRAWEQWQSDRSGARVKLAELERRNNEYWIEAYGLQDELSPEVSNDQITLYRPVREEDIKRLLSYAIGCMMGRYSLDKPGLVYAHSGNQGFDASQNKTFQADEDGILPLTEFNWFPDDAASRFEKFIATAWPVDHLDDNLEFVAESLGPKKGESPRETIRRYLASDFYKHHLSLYKKRPIYWLFSSGKQRGFQALVYLHRYNEGTLARMRTEYVIPLLGKMAARNDHLTDDIAAASSSQHRKRLETEKATIIKQRAEVQAFDEKLRHRADQRIKLDLDDGVKVNYGKFGDLLAEVKAVTGGASDE